MGFLPFKADRAQPRGAALWLAVVVSLAFILSCTAQAATVEVRIQEANPHFNPLTVNIQVGDTVRWIWNDSMSHSVTSGDGNTGTPNGVFDSGIHSPPFTFSVTFQNAGSFPYYCRAHYHSNTSGVWPVVNVTASTVTASTLRLGDFNGDGFTDYLLFNPSNRKTAIWHLQGAGYVSGGYGPTLPAGWVVGCVADLNLDGKPDYVLFNTSTRRTAVWFLNNATFLSSVYGPTLPSGWTLQGAADFNADAKPDYVLFNASTRQTAIWFLNGTAFTGSAYGPTLPAGWTLIDAVDFNGNGRTDFLLSKSSTRQTAIWYLNGTAFVSSAYGPTPPSGWTLQGAADFNADAKPDYVLFQASTRRTALWYLNGATFAGSVFGPTLPAGY